jgi:endo-alpha-1,4-polygalactosaminidase (GH114 family)
MSFNDNYRIELSIEGDHNMLTLKMKKSLKVSLLLIGFFTSMFSFASGVWASGTLTTIPYLNKGFVLGTAGNTTSDSSEVLNGVGSIKGSYSRNNSYTAYLYTDPNIIKLVPGQTYSITFNYRILTTPDIGFEVLFYSPIGGGEGVWLPSYTIAGTAGETGTAKLTNTLGPYEDYQAHWNIIGTGSIIIDNIKIVNDLTGQIVAQEDAEQVTQSYVFDNIRTDYILNLSENSTDVINKNTGVHTSVPFGERMLFGGTLKYSKDSSYLIHNVRSHAETYIDWDDIKDLPVDFLRSAPTYSWDGKTPRECMINLFDSPHRFPDQSDKVIVAYVNLSEFSTVGLEFFVDPLWDKDENFIIDNDIEILPDYVDINVYNSPWKVYVAAYWTDSWREIIKTLIDLVAVQNFNGVMFDVMTGANSWIHAYPSMDITELQTRMVEHIKWASDYAKGEYGSAFLITVNFDHHMHKYFSDLGEYVDGGYYQNAYFAWDGSARIEGGCLSTSESEFVSPSIDFLKSQGLSVLNMDHLNTGESYIKEHELGYIDFVNYYDDRITEDNLLSIFRWAIDSGSTPFVSPVEMKEPFLLTPRFERIFSHMPMMPETEYNDWIIGSEVNDKIFTGDGDDLVFGGPGDDQINGGEGHDTCLYLESSEEYRFYKAGNTIAVSAILGNEGTDMLENIERLIFKDTVINVSDLPDSGPFPYRKSIAILTSASHSHTVTTGSDEKVYGDSTSNQIILEKVARVELINFPGLNSVEIQADASLFTVSRSGTVVTFTGSDGTVLKMPATTDIQTISFNGEESRVLQIHNNQVMLDDQIITLTPAPIENNATNNLIGSWLYDADGLEYSAVVTFIDDTNYMFAVDGEPDDGGGRGMERGVYDWDPSSGEMLASALSQTAGDWGVSDFNTDTLTVVVSNDTLYFDTNDGLVQFSKISSADNPIIGSWLYHAEGLENSAILTFIDDTNYMFAVDGEPDDGGGRGMERGTYIWDTSSGVFNAEAISNTAGDWGISSLAAETQSVSISGDMLNFNNTSDGLIQFKKIKD